jgi:hypothetical protein
LPKVFGFFSFFFARKFFPPTYLPPIYFPLPINYLPLPTSLPPTSPHFAFIPSLELEAGTTIIRARECLNPKERERHPYYGQQGYKEYDDHSMDQKFFQQLPSKSHKSLCFV